MKLGQIAFICHEANRAYCQTLGDWSQPPYEDAPGDWSQPPYEDAPTWQQKSALEGVRFHQEHPDATDADSHQAWLKHKEAEGWTHGDVKDPVAKTHPCMLPFDELPEEQRKKDRLFRLICKALL